MYSLQHLMMDEKTVRNMKSVITKKYKFDTLVLLVGFTIEVMLIYLCSDCIYPCKLYKHKVCNFVISQVAEGLVRFE